jgi:hypothetical protein
MLTDADLEFEESLHRKYKWDKKDRKAFVERMISKANSRENRWE